MTSSLNGNLDSLTGGLRLDPQASDTEEVVSPLAGTLRLDAQVAGNKDVANSLAGVTAHLQLAPHTPIPSITGQLRPADQIRVFLIGAASALGVPDLYREDEEIKAKRGPDLEACFTKMEKAFADQGKTLITFWPCTGKADYLDKGGNPRTEFISPIQSKSGRDDPIIDIVSEIRGIFRTEKYKTDRFDSYDPETIGNDRGPVPFKRSTKTLKQLKFEESHLAAIPDGKEKVKALRNILWLDQYCDRLKKHINGKIQHYTSLASTDPGARQQEAHYQRIAERLEQMDKFAIQWALAGLSREELAKHIASHPAHQARGGITALFQKLPMPTTRAEEIYLDDVARLGIFRSGNPEEGRQAYRNASKALGSKIAQDSFEQHFCRLVAHMDHKKDDYKTDQDPLLVNRLLSELTVGLASQGQTEFIQAMASIMDEMNTQRIAFDNANNEKDFNAAAAPFKPADLTPHKMKV